MSHTGQHVGLKMVQKMNHYCLNMRQTLTTCASKDVPQMINFDLNMSHTLVCTCMFLRCATNGTFWFKYEPNVTNLSGYTNLLHPEYFFPNMSHI